MVIKWSSASLIYKFKENMFASNRIVGTDVVMTVIGPVHELLIFLASVSSEGPGKSVHMLYAQTCKGLRCSHTFELEI